MKNYQKTKREVSQHLHFWELPNECRFWLNNEFWNKVYSFKKRKFKSWKGVGKQININKGTLRNYLSQKNNTKWAQFIPLSVLKKVCILSGIALDKAEKYIKSVKSGKTGKSINLKFPINLLAKEWAGLIGALLSEGHISHEYDAQFWNKDKEIINKFIFLLEKIAPRVIHSTKYRDAYYCNLPRIITHILISGFGLHIGDKVTSNPAIPKIYMNLDLSTRKYQKIVGNLLSWLFTGDGWVSLFKDHLEKTHRHMGIGFSIISKGKAPALLEDTHKLIKKFGICPQKVHFSDKKEYVKNSKKQTTESWKFFIHGKENFELFQKYINFKDTRRREVLQKAIESFVKPNLRKGEPIVKVVASVIKNAPCTKHNISQDTRLQTKRIEILLKEAKDSGFVKVIGGGEKARRYGRKPYIYKSTIEGTEFVKEKGGKFL